MTDERRTLGDIGDIAVFGDGWLGNKIVERLGARMAKGVNITDSSEVALFLYTFKPRLIVNAAGRAGPPTALRRIAGIPQNIDWCAMTSGIRAQTTRANVQGPKVLGRECAKRGIRVVHLSSGCLWNGPSEHDDGAWLETDEPQPVSFYAETKVEGERALREACGDTEPLIVRIRLPIDGEPNGRNLITKLAGYPEIMDVVNSVTVVDSFLLTLDVLIRDELFGTYHVVNPGPISHREIMSWYCELVNKAHAGMYEIVPEEEVKRLGRVSEGRSSCILNTSKLKADAKINLSEARVAVRKCLRQYKRELEEKS